MATVPSNPKLRDVQSVFGGTQTLRYYRRGNGIPDIGAYSAVSTTTPTLRQFADLVYPAIQLSPVSIYANQTTTPGGGSASAAMYLFANGSQQVWTSTTTDGPIFTSLTTWLLAGSASNYDANFIKTSGDAVVGLTPNTWYNLSTDRSWGFGNSVVEGQNWFRSAYGYLVIRPAGGGGELANVSVTMQVELQA